MNDQALQKALAVVAEAQVRMEQKIDLLMQGFGMNLGVHPQLGFIGQMCPVCKSMVEYQIDIDAQVVKRSCGCKTGKQPVFIPLVPVEEEKTDGRAADAGGAGTAGEESSPDRDRRQGR